MSTSPDPFIDKLVTEFLDRVSEHCDSVVVFITTPSGNSGTDSLVEGRGNWFAQYGHVRSWLLQRDQSERNRIGFRTDT